MMSRRHIRIKVLQAIYAYIQNIDPDILRGQHELIRSIDKLHELYIYQLSFLLALFEFAGLRLEEAKQKYLPTEEDLNPNTRFVDNLVIAKLSENRDYIRRASQLKISWKDQEELVRRMNNAIRGTPEYQEYMAAGQVSFEADKAFILHLLRKHIYPEEGLVSLYEEKNIYWANDYPVVYQYVEKTIRALEEEHRETDPLPGLPADPDEEDREFAVDLYRKTIRRTEEYEKLISQRTLNWDAERIAMMDMILLKMALAEFTEFPTIPIKVSFNEYIEISKEYSTPKSKVFINGVLDKLILELTAEQKIKKSGRGLIDQ